MVDISLLFFNISGAELVIILLVVFVIFGPGKIPEMAKMLGRGLYEIKRASADIRREIDSEIRKVEQKIDVNSTSKKEEKTEEAQNTKEDNK